MRSHGVTEEDAICVGGKRNNRDWDRLSPIPFHTISPPQSPSFEQGPPREYFPAVISQEIDERSIETAERELGTPCEPPSLKKSRMRAWKSQILRDTCLGMRSCDGGKAQSHETTPPPFKKECSQKQRWWEHPQTTVDQREHTSSAEGTIEPSCFVCQKQDFGASARCKGDGDVVDRKQSKSILSYFAPSPHSPDSSRDSTGTVPLAKTAHHESRRDRNFFNCAFCDRSACHSCMKECEGCSDNFCTFCSTTNYTESAERYFCLDCDVKASVDSCDKMDLS